MGKIRNILLWLMAVIMLFGCAASRKTEGSRSEERRNSTVVAITDSVKKTEVKTDSTLSITTDESHTSGTTSEKGRGEETVQERVTESTDAKVTRPPPPTARYTVRATMSAIVLTRNISSIWNRPYHVCSIR